MFTGPVSIQMITDQPEAVLNLLSIRKTQMTLRQVDWQPVLESEGYRRLKQREIGMGTPFTDLVFQGFLMTRDLLIRSDALAEALEQWKLVDLQMPLNRALAYLPVNTHIQARIYPVIKPKTNSFVFEPDTNPAIFIYLNPDVNNARFTNTLTHELHHIGSANAEHSLKQAPYWQTLAESQRAALEWVGAFGEGMAMLAAAGGPDVHPHLLSGEEERARWDMDLEHFNQDLPILERFFLDVLDGKLQGKDVFTAGFEFFGIQGPWYTVGWQMATLIEKYTGRQNLITCFYNPWRLLAEYNMVVARYNQETLNPLAQWSETLLEKLSVGLPEKIISVEME